MAYFKDQTLQRYSISSEEVGVYGEPIPTYKENGTIHCDFQQERNQEIAHAYGVELSDLYQIFLDENTILDYTDILVKDNVAYDIIGNIIVYGKFHHTKQAHLIRRRTAWERA